MNNPADNHVLNFADSPKEHIARLRGDILKAVAATLGPGPRIVMAMFAPLDGPRLPLPTDALVQRPGDWTAAVFELKPEHQGERLAIDQFDDPRFWVQRSITPFHDEVTALEALARSYGIQVPNRALRA
jgi:hypothetical protein